MNLKDLPSSHNHLVTEPRLKTQVFLFPNPIWRHSKLPIFLLNKMKHASKHARLRQSTWAEAKQLARSPPWPPQGYPGSRTQALLTWGPRSTFLRKAGHPFWCTWASCRVNLFHGLILMYARVKPSSCPVRTNLKCDTSAMFLLPCISLKVWTLFDQATWTAKKLWQPAWNFFSTIISIYPGKKKKRKGSECYIVFL